MVLGWSQNLTASIEMTDVRLNFPLPVVTPNHKPILHTRIEFRVDESFPWTLQDDVLAPLDELLLVDVAPGTYFYQATVFDTDLVSGPPSNATATIGFLPPGSTVLTATVE